MAKPHSNHKARGRHRHIKRLKTYWGYLNSGIPQEVRGVVGGIDPTKLSDGKYDMVGEIIITEGK